MVSPQSHKPLDRSLQIVHLKLEIAGMRYVFLSFIAVLVLVGGIATIAPVGRAGSSNDSNQAETDTDRAKNAKIRTPTLAARGHQEIKTQSRRDHDAHLRGISSVMEASALFV